MAASTAAPKSAEPVDPQAVHPRTTAREADELALPASGGTRPVRWVGRGVALSLALGVVLLAGAGLAWGAPVNWGALWGEVWRIAGSPEVVKAYFEGFGVWAPVAFFLTQAVQVVVAIIPSGPVTLAGVAAFGPWWGLALSVGGGTAGSVVAFALGRRFGRPMVARMVGEEVLDRYARKVGTDGRWLLLALQVPIPVGGDALCALAGLSKLSLWRFTLVSAVGRVPWTAFNVLVAAGLASGSVGAVISVVIVAVVSGVLAARYRRPLEGLLIRHGQRRRDDARGDGAPRDDDLRDAA